MISVQKDDLLVLSHQVKLFVWLVSFLNSYEVYFLAVWERLEVGEATCWFSYMHILNRIMGDLILLHLLFDLIFQEDIWWMNNLIEVLLVIHSNQLDLLVFLWVVIETFLPSLDNFLVIKDLLFTLLCFNQELRDRHWAPLVKLLRDHRHLAHFGPLSVINAVKAADFEDTELLLRLLWFYLFLLDLKVLL